MNINTTKNTVNTWKHHWWKALVLLDVIRIKLKLIKIILMTCWLAKSRMKYEWNYSDQDVYKTGCLVKKSDWKKSWSRQPTKTILFDQKIDLSVRLNDPILSQSLSNSIDQGNQKSFPYTDIGKICWLVQESRINSKRDLTQENFCKQVCSELKMPYSDNVRQSFRKYDTGNHTLTKKIISNFTEKSFSTITWKS